MIKNKNIYIIGGSSGIGLALADLLSSSNNIYIASRSSDNLSGLNVHHITFDATSEILDTSLLPEKLDGFVYCPGSINLRPFKGLSVEAFEKDFQINVTGAINSLKNVLGNLSASGNASIVFFSTVAVQTGMPFHSSVAASKGAIEGLTRSLAAEFAPKIRVNAIAPGYVKTDITNLPKKYEHWYPTWHSQTPMNRLAEPHEIASAALFLCSPASSYVTGEVLVVDGGYTTR